MCCNETPACSKEACTAPVLCVGVVAGAAAGTDISTTATPQQRAPEERGAARVGSATSTLTVDDDADLSRANTALAAAEAGSSTVAGAGTGVEEGVGAEETAVAEEKEEQGPKKGETLDNTPGDGAGCSGGITTTITSAGGQGGAEAVAPASTEGVPLPSGDAALSTDDGGDTLELGQPRGSTSSRLSSDGRETVTGGFMPAATAATASTTSDAPRGLRPHAAASEGAGTDKNGSSDIDGATAGDGDNYTGPAHAQQHPKCGGEWEGEGVAEWWCEALEPRSRRPITRRSLVSGGAIGGAIGGWTRGAGCVRERQEETAGQREGDKRITYDGGDDGGSGGSERRRSRTAAPICGFSTESKHRDLEDFLKHRCDAEEGRRKGK